MKNLLVAGLFAVAFSGPAFAQDAPAQDATVQDTTAQDATTPAISDDQTNPDAPVPGANSFTEDQARTRISEAGYIDVSGLTKDDNGIWHGKASKDGAVRDVQVDFQGNVTSK